MLDCICKPQYELDCQIKTIYTFDMSEWTGIDPVGTERLFEPSALRNALDVFK